MIKIATDLLKHLRAEFFKEIKLHKNKIQKTNCMQKVLSVKKIDIGQLQLPLTLSISETCLDGVNTCVELADE